jgi:NAD(P)-dependent dehydrogenase (short-subunit alcohol dehydrogenase family)
MVTSESGIPIRICVAGITGWTGKSIAAAIATAPDLHLVSGVSRSTAGPTIPAGHYGDPGDLGALVAFLASESARYIAGQSVIINGGLVPALP